MSPGNVAGIAAQRRVKCNGSEAEDVPNKNTTKDTLGFPSCSNMVDDCGMVCSKSNDCMKVCSTFALQINFSTFP